MAEEQRSNPLLLDPFVHNASSLPQRMPRGLSKCDKVQASTFYNEHDFPAPALLSGGPCGQHSRVRGARRDHCRVNAKPQKTSEAHYRPRRIVHRGPPCL